MRKFTKKEIKKLKIYWKELSRIQDEFHFHVELLEMAMQHDLNIDDLEFIFIDGYCGIGNINRTIKLLNEEELEKK